jgi:hypothetical protein
MKTLIDTSGDRTVAVETTVEVMPFSVGVDQLYCGNVAGRNLPGQSIKQPHSQASELLCAPGQNPMLMKRRRLLFSSASAVFLTACGGAITDQPAIAEPPNVVVGWNDALLGAVRVVKPAPPMVARTLAIMHTAMYDAWAAYDAVALATVTAGSLRRPDSERIAGNKAKAISYAAYRVLIDQYPTERPRFDALMTTYGYSLSNNADTNTPEGIGNTVAKIILVSRHADGSNQLGNMTVSGQAFADYTGYRAVNPATVFTASTALSEIPEPAHWQPLTYIDAAGLTKTPAFITPHWMNVTPFALTSAFQFRPTAPAAFGTVEYQAQAVQVMKFLVELTDQQKVSAEYWADGPKSETPPGHFCLFAQFVSIRDRHTNDQAVKMFLAISNAMLDASIASWDAKRFYDYVRPITAIRFLFNGQTIKGYGSSGVPGGLVDIKGDAWRPYQLSTFPTPPFAEHSSGHSAFSSAGAEVLKLFTGSDLFGGTYTQLKGSLKVEPGAPLRDVTLEWPTFTAAAADAGLSRLYGGIHFPNGDQAGREIGRKVGAQAFAKARSYWLGNG